MTSMEWSFQIGYFRIVISKVFACSGMHSRQAIQILFENEFELLNYSDVKTSYHYIITTEFL